MSCYLCEKNERETYFSYFCKECRRVKHLLNLYSDDVYNTLETVLVRTKKQQEHKIKTTIDSKIVAEEKEEEKPLGYNLRTKK